MAVDNPNVIDFIGTDKETNEVILSISDHLDWANVPNHLEVLQSKINGYISFIESGEIYEIYKAAKNGDIIIEVIGKFDLPLVAIDFYNQANTILVNVKTKLRFKFFK